MAGKVWFWSRNRLGVRLLSPQAWRDGIPESTDAVIVSDDCKLPPTWRELGEPLVLNGGAALFASWKWDEISSRLKRSGVSVMKPEIGARAEFSNRSFCLSGIFSFTISLAADQVERLSIAKRSFPERGPLSNALATSAEARRPGGNIQLNLVRLFTFE